MEDGRRLGHLPLARPPDALRLDLDPAPGHRQSKKTKIFDYEIPLRIDGKKGAIHGTLYWVGTANTSKLPFIIAGIVIVLGGGAAGPLHPPPAGTATRTTSDEAKPAKEAW